MYYDRKWLPDFRSAVGAQDGFSVAFAYAPRPAAVLLGDWTIALLLAPMSKPGLA